MGTKSLREFVGDETAQKRAQRKYFSFDVEAPRMVEVINESYVNPAEHHYIVTLDDVTGDVLACTCPHHVHRNASCKHMAAVENATDDGTLDAFPSDDENDAEPAECDCDGLNGFPCWPCVRAGRKELPN